VTRVLVVDDSALVRRLLRRLLTEEAGLETAFAADGEAALAALASFKPDVVTLDINMPGMDGLACLDRIMLERPTPVIMFSSLTAEGAEQSVEALALGAVDVMQKPDGAFSLGLDAIGPTLLAKIEIARGARLKRTHRLTERVRALAGSAPRARRQRATVGHATAAAVAPGPVATGLVLVGCSTGGPPALDALLAPLPADFPCPIVVAQHMPAAFTGPLARRLDSICELTVQEVAQATALAPGHVYVGRGEGDVLIARRGETLWATPAPASAEYAWHPSVERMVASALGAAPAVALVGVLMTGMGDDGAAAMTRLHAGGGWTLAQDEASAVVWGMPGALVRAGGAAHVAPLDQLSTRLAARVATAAAR
jgi:two-component system chemotaxis response regulator CheB